MGTKPRGRRPALAALLGTAVAGAVGVGLWAYRPSRAAPAVGGPAAAGGCQPATPSVLATAGPGSPGLARAGVGCAAAGQATGGLPLLRYPDAPVEPPPPAPASVRFVVEHRSALHGTALVVRGVVAAVRPALPARGTRLGRPPELTLADSAAPDRDRAYDVRLTLPPAEDGTHRVGDVLERPWRVYGSREHVTLERLG